MKKFYHSLLFSIAGLFCLQINVPAFAGAWNLPPGEGQIITTYDYSEASSAFADAEIEDLSLSFVKNEGRLFFEHGLTQHLTFVGNGAYQTIQFSSSQSEINFSDFADIEIGLRYQLTRKEGLATSIQASYIIGGGPPDSLLDLNGPEDSVELRGLWGQSKEFENFSIFFDVQGALRSENFSDIDEWHTDLTLGYKRNEKYLLLGQLFHSSLDGEVLNGDAGDGILVPRQRRVKLKLSAVYEYKKNKHVQIGVQETIAGRNTVRERGVSLGTWIRY